MGLPSIMSLLMHQSCWITFESYSGNLTDNKKTTGPTRAVLIDHRQLPPFEERDHVQDGPGDGGVLGEQVDEEGVFVVHRRVFPAGLYVRDLQGVADGLNGADRGAVGRAEHSDHPKSQLVAH